MERKSTTFLIVNQVFFVVENHLSGIWIWANTLMKNLDLLMSTSFSVGMPR